jgi:putative hydrolase of HD superfamily
MTDAELHGCLDFIRQTEKLKDVLRNSYTASGRHESTAEHSWRLALMAMVFGRDLGTVDLLRVLKLCLIHDLGEAIGGDVPAIHQNGGAGKAAQERADLITLLEPLDAARRAEFLALWDEYEAAATPEARLVKALDKMETIIQHNQGATAPDFDHGFNLDYGRHYAEGHPLLARLRRLVDADTRARMAEATPPPRRTGSEG